MDTEILKNVGLTDLQAKIYLHLIEHGQQTPAKIASQLSENRTTVYSAAEKLEQLGILTRSEIDKIFHFSAANPTILRSHLRVKKKQLSETSTQLEAILPNLLSMFRLTSDQPGITTLEGKESIIMVYDEILKANQEVLIFASKNDCQDPTIASLINQQIARQQKAGIPIKSLVRAAVFPEFQSKITDLYDVRPLPADTEFEAQIIIFKDITVLTIFTEGITSTIINSPQAAATLRSAFFAIWNSAST